MRKLVLSAMALAMTVAFVGCGDTGTTSTTTTTHTTATTTAMTTAMTTK